jgi:hypothetical protein
MRGAAYAALAGEADGTSSTSLRARLCGTAPAAPFAFLGLAATFALLMLTSAILLARGPAHRPAGGYGAYVPPFSVYPAPTDTGFPSSPYFAVNVTFRFSNGSDCSPSLPAHVYTNSINHRRGDNGADIAKPDQSVSWASFAFDSALYEALVTVTMLDGIVIPGGESGSGCVLRPRSYGLVCTVAPDGRSATILLQASPRKVSVEVLSAALGNSLSFVANPLFLFPDPPEDPDLIPPPTAPGVLYFGRGVHNISGGQMQIPCGTNNVYLAPGAYVSGGFRTTCGGSFREAAEAVLFSGRGIVTGEMFPWHSPLFTWALVNIDEGVGNTVDGLTLVDSPEFYMASYTESPTIRNVKMLGSWPYNSDGFDTGNNGVVEDCFVRSNDDSIKISGGSNTVVQRIVVWQMLNGAVVQMGWVPKLGWQGTTVRDIDVIHVDYCQTAAGWCEQSDNEAVVDLAPDGVSVIGLASITVQNVRVEGDAVRLLSVQLPQAGAGSFQGLLLANVAADSESLFAGDGSTNLLSTTWAPSGEEGRGRRNRRRGAERGDGGLGERRLGAPSAAGGGGSGPTLSGVVFSNVTVGGACWRDLGSAKIVVSGNVAPPKFVCSA